MGVSCIHWTPFVIRSLGIYKGKKSICVLQIMWKFVLYICESRVSCPLDNTPSVVCSSRINSIVEPPCSFCYRGTIFFGNKNVGLSDYDLVLSSENGGQARGKGTIPHQTHYWKLSQGRSPQYFQYIKNYTRQNLKGDNFCWIDYKK